MSLTDEGALFLQYAKDLLSKYEAARHIALAEGRKMPTGLLAGRRASAFRERNSCLK